MSRNDIAYALDWVFLIAKFAIFAECLLSWVPPLRNSAVGRIVFSIVDPMLAPIRNLIAKSPLGGGGAPIDFSPLIAFLLLVVLRGLVGTLIRGF